MDLGLQDKLIVVTGGGSGIGAGVSRACLKEGARVVVLDQASETVEAFMAEMAASYAECFLAACDSESLDRSKTAIAEIEARHGEIYGLVNIAGLREEADLERDSVDRFVQGLEQNLVHFYAAAHFALGSLKKTQGTIVNISFRVEGPENSSGSKASNGAQLALTREWAAELLPYNIRVNAVLPAAMREDSLLEVAAMTVFLLSPKQSAHTTGQHLLV